MYRINNSIRNEGNKFNDINIEKKRIKFLFNKRRCNVARLSPKQSSLLDFHQNNISDETKENIKEISMENKKADTIQKSYTTICREENKIEYLKFWEIEHNSIIGLLKNCANYK